MRFGYFIAILLTSVVTEASEPAFKTRPNIILIMTDDQGYGEMGHHGNPLLKTPNVDRLARQSTRFTQFHVSPTCAPTRSALLTGRHEFRNGVTHTIFERERLRLDAVTLPQILQTAGYRTGIFGKWHLGDEEAYQPNRRGFDEVFIHGAGGIGQTYPGSCGDIPNNSYFGPTILHNGQFVRTSKYCTDVFMGQAQKWIAEQTDPKKLFFCYITPNAPHSPYLCPDEFAEPYLKAGLKEPEARYYGMIANFDQNLGRLLAFLDETQRSQNTLLIFMTDNGHSIGSLFNAGMRSAKGSPYQGGTRVPLFIRWPDRVPADVEIPVLTAHIDVVPTLLEVTGTDVPESLPLEGRSLVPLLKNPQAPWEDRILYTHVGRWEKGQASAAKYRNCRVRNSRFSLISTSRDGKKAWELFDLQNDPGELTNVLSAHPDVARQLEQAYDTWWSSIQKDLVNENAQGPAINPFKEKYWQQFPDERP